MALLIFLIGTILGWFVHPPKRAAAATVAAGLAFLIIYLVIGLSDLVVSPLETIVLLLGTPLAAALAFRLARWRASQQTIRE